MVTAELMARRTAAAGLAADFRAEVSRHPATWQPAAEWAFRLALALEELTEAIGTGPACDANRLAEIRHVLDSALSNEHADRQHALEQIDAIVNGGDGR